MIQLAFNNEPHYWVHSGIISVSPDNHLLPEVHHHYFEPEFEEFEPGNLWSLSNAFTSAFKNWHQSSSTRRQRNSVSSLNKRSNCSEEPQ